MYRRLTIACLIFILGGCAKTVTVRPPYPPITQQEMIGEPSTGSAFKMRMAPDDPIGSLKKCMDKVHKKNKGKGIGYCYIAESSLRPGKHNTLAPKYRDVQVAVR